jgi:ATP synthase subunit 6
MLFAPLEQFEIISVYKLNLLNIDFSCSNFIIINLLSLFIIIIIIFLKSVSQNKNLYLYFIPNIWQNIFESITIIIVAQLLINSIRDNSNQYFLFITIIFNFILLSNFIGLIPYSFTTTSHLYITFTFAFSIFIGINIIIINKYKLKTLLLFFPSNTSLYLALVLVPIELISYIAKPISLGVRLFINLMAGHTLLKVVVGFSLELLILENFNSFYLIFPMFMLIILFGLELGVAVIQTYVFIILTCIYIQDGN